MMPTEVESTDTTTSEASYNFVDSKSPCCQQSPNVTGTQTDDDAIGINIKQQRKENSQQEHRAVIPQKRRRLDGQYDRSRAQDVEACQETAWSVEEHRAFARAVYNIGLKHSSPTVLRENMSPTTPEAVTHERIKSHLQKYRKNRIKSENEFFSSYDAWMSNVMRFVHSKQGIEQESTRMPADLPAEMTSPDKLSSGAMAAHIAFSIMMEGKTQAGSGGDGIKPLEYSTNTEELPFHLYVNDHEKEIQFPRLSDEEKQSPLGTSMCLLMGLFVAFQDQLFEARKRSADRRGTHYRGEEANNPFLLPSEPWKEQHEMMAQSDQAVILEDFKPRAVRFASSSEPRSHPPPYSPMNESLANYAATGQTSIQPLPMQMPVLDLLGSVDLDVYQPFQPHVSFSSRNCNTENVSVESRHEAWGVIDSPLREAYNESKLADEQANYHGER